jgi:carboxymethylenebutenolidase
MGDMIRIKSRDGFELDAYHVKPAGARKGGVMVIQEIFGLSDHIREMTDRFGAEGYEAIAPSMYDRAAPGFIVQAKDVAAGMAKGRELAMGIGQVNALYVVGGVFDVL